MRRSWHKCPLLSSSSGRFLFRPELPLLAESEQNSDWHSADPMERSSKLPILRFSFTSALLVPAVQTAKRGTIWQKKNASNTGAKKQSLLCYAHIYPGWAKWKISQGGLSHLIHNEMVMNKSTIISLSRAHFIPQGSIIFKCFKIQTQIP